ncbi:hypothetical protein U8Q05_12215 [Rhizobium ruizarguesonis]|nr:hypothetical protein U8Q05_12215 [Rhizobium ruizarguesonis]
MSKSKFTWERPREEIEQALTSQLRFLRRSCEAYDRGEHDEAARIATAIFIIVHDGSQTSLLTQLKLRSGLRFDSYAAIQPTGHNILSDFPVVGLRIEDNTMKNVPVLDDGPPQMFHKVQFGRWWDKEEIFRCPSGLKLTRRGLIFAMRNQDMGGHVDARLTDEAYVKFSRDSRTAFFDNGSEAVEASPRPHLPTIRHIAYELVRTLEQSLPETIPTK